MTNSSAAIAAAEYGNSRPAGMVDGQLVYAVGDIHGRYDLLRALLATISVDAAERAKGRIPRLIFCGDYIDRGPATAQVLDALCWLKRHRPFDVQFLMGNHEEVLLAYIADPIAAKTWMKFGGCETLRSYGISPPSATAPDQAHLDVRDDLLERMPIAHLRFVEELQLIVGVGDYVFVHAGVRPGVPLAKQTKKDLLWIREGFLDGDHSHERIVVHGHSWNDARPVILPHRIGVDTGAYKTGILTAVRLEDGVVDFLSSDCAKSEHYHEDMSGLTEMRGAS